MLRSEAGEMSSASLSVDATAMDTVRKNFCNGARASRCQWRASRLQHLAVDIICCAMCGTRLAANVARYNATFSELSLGLSLPRVPQTHRRAERKKNYSDYLP
jgi:hypothetical protein